MTAVNAILERLKKTTKKLVIKLDYETGFEQLES
jgi:hypothetical protein